MTGKQGQAGIVESGDDLVIQIIRASCEAAPHGDRVLADAGSVAYPNLIGLAYHSPGAEAASKGGVMVSAGSESHGMASASMPDKRRMQHGSLVRIPVFRHGSTQN